MLALEISNIFIIRLGLGDWRSICNSDQSYNFFIGGAITFFVGVVKVVAAVVFAVLYIVVVVVVVVLTIVYFIVGAVVIVCVVIFVVSFHDAIISAN